MKKLDLPCTDAEDNNVIVRACKKYDWGTYEGSWTASYDLYRKHGGDPWGVAAASFPPNIKSALYSLYDDRKSGGPLKRIRDAGGQLCCPLCGSGALGSLDHYLPRKEYNEFSIMRANLVPACANCNSGAKGTTYKGAPGERLIHPYFDSWADQEIWFVEVQGPFEAATFKAKPSSHLDNVKNRIVTFHLDTVLATQFHIWIETRWSRLPIMMSTMGVPKSFESARDFIDAEHRRAVAGEGQNGWNAALMRGISTNAGAIAYLMNRLA